MTVVKFGQKNFTCMHSDIIAVITAVPVAVESPCLRSHVQTISLQQPNETLSLGCNCCEHLQLPMSANGFRASIYPLLRPSIVQTLWLDLRSGTIAPHEINPLYLYKSNEGFPRNQLESISPSCAFGRTTSPGL
eukprot:m.89266 g.89266  ORF g.89266 m.89266 type:complete len:134 (+) comp8828_c0_seq5:2059-2460(+)